MAFAEIDKQIAQTSDGLAVTVTFDSVGAHLIVLVCAAINGDAVVNGDFSSSPDIGNPTGILTAEDVGGGERCTIAYWDSFTGDATQDITLTKSYASVYSLAVSGDAASTFEKEPAGANTYGTTLTMTSVTPDTDDALIVQGVAFNTDGNTPTIDGSYTGLLTVDHVSGSPQKMGCAGAYRIISGSPVSSAPTWTFDVATSAAGTTAVFALTSGGGGGGTPSRLTLLGVG